MLNRKPNQRTIYCRARKMVNILYLNGIMYSPPHESWIKKTDEDNNVWTVIPYYHVTSIAHFTLHGMTNKIPSLDTVKAVLVQIERWMLESQGQIVEVKWQNGKLSWCPICLLAYN